MRISTNGTSFIAGSEGFASKAYRCPANVITIGYGFTMGSRVFAEFWRAKHGRALQMGDTISKADANKVLTALLNDEYGAAVTRKVGTVVQHQWDGATSVAFNCGTGSLGWRWAQALARKAVGECADLLRVTAVTANGRKLNGLVRRRKHEAELIEHGNYGALKTASIGPSVSTAPADVKWYQEGLAALGYQVIVDGKDGPETKAEVRKFQADHGLKVDGIVGPATRATIIRALDKSKQNKSAGAAGAGGAATGGGVEGTAFDPAMADVALSALYWGLGAAVVVLVLFIIWRNRGKFTGKRVPT